MKKKLVIKTLFKTYTTEHVKFSYEHSSTSMFSVRDENDKIVLMIPLRKIRSVEIK